MHAQCHHYFSPYTRTPPLIEPLRQANCERRRNCSPTNKPYASPGDDMRLYEAWQGMWRGTESRLERHPGLLELWPPTFALARVLDSANMTTGDCSPKQKASRMRAVLASREDDGNRSYIGQHFGEHFEPRIRTNNRNPTVLLQPGNRHVTSLSSVRA